MRTAILIAAEVFNEDPRLHSLSCPGRDVDELKRVLELEEHWPYRCVSLKNIHHAEALKTIYKELQNKQNELVLIYYSGHGKLDRSGQLHLCTSNTEVELLPATSIPAEAIRKYLEDSPVRQTILILDCCFSGAMDDAFRKKGLAEDEAQAAFSNSFGGRGIYLITSSTRSQTSREKEGDSNSVFTKYLIDAIENTKTDDGYISVDDIYTQVYNRMRSNPEQLPTRSDFGGLGTVYLAKTRMRESNDPYHFAKKRLFRMYDSDNLPYRIAIDAAELFAHDSRLLSDAQRMLLKLTSQLFDETVPVHEFVRLWTEQAPQSPQAIPSPLDKPELEFPKDPGKSADELSQEGDRYYCQKGDSKDNAKARIYYERAAALGSSNGMYKLGLMYENGDGIQQDYVQARRCFEGAAAWDSALAMRRLGALYRLGNGVAKDHIKALQWYEKAANLGNADALRVLGAIYADGDGVKPDLVRALQYYEDAARLGSGDALVSIGNLYEMGRGVKRNLAKAIEYYEKACGLGDNEAMHRLGHICEGNNRQSAFKYFSMAADAGNIEAPSDIARMYEKSNPPDATKALEWCNRGIELGSGKAIFVMGLFYYFGRVVPKDYKQAINWLQKAAAQGQDQAMCALGMFYRNGYGVPVDLKVAREWLEKSAERGYTTAMRELAELSLNDKKQAEMWLQKAVAKGDYDAMYELARLVSWDKARSSRLMRMASEGGSTKASEALRNVPPSLLERIKRAF